MVAQLSWPAATDATLFDLFLKWSAGMQADQLSESHSVDNNADAHCTKMEAVLAGHCVFAASLSTVYGVLCS